MGKSKKEIHLYTDGSSVNNGVEKGLGGYGFLLLYGDFSNADMNTKYCDEKFTLSGFKGYTNTTNQREELKAVIEGLKRIKNKTIKIQVYSDSAYVVNCMNDKWYVNWRTNGWKNSTKKPVVNRDLWEELLSVIEDGFLNVTFNKVKAHVGIPYNEAVDDIARMGLEEARAMVASGESVNNGKS